MTLSLSSGLKNEVANGDDYIATLNKGTIHFYTATRPTDADSAESGTLVAKITVDGLTLTPGSTTNGLTIELDSGTAGKIIKAAAETWEGTALATDDIAWFRWYDNDVVTGASTTAKRIDGDVTATGGGGDITMSSVSVDNGANVPVNSFSLQI